MSALLEVDDLNVRYGGVHAVSDVHMRVEEGAVVGLIGPNGAGKTSMIDALTGYHRPASGRVRFAGEDITGVRPHRRARRGLARTFQSIELFDDLTVEENLLVASDDVTTVQALVELLLAAPADARSDRLGAIGVRAGRRRRTLAQGSFARAAQAGGRRSRAGAAAAPGPDGRAGGRAGHQRDRRTRHAPALAPRRGRRRSC